MDSTPLPDSNTIPIDQNVITYSLNNEIKINPENNFSTSVLDKDIIRWKRKLEELSILRTPWSTILASIGLSIISTDCTFLNKSTRFLSYSTLFMFIGVILLTTSFMLWKWYGTNISTIAKDILHDFPKINERQ